MPGKSGARAHIALVDNVDYAEGFAEQRRRGGTVQCAARRSTRETTASQPLGRMAVAGLDTARGLGWSKGAEALHALNEIEAPSVQSRMATRPP